MGHCTSVILISGTNDDESWAQRLKQLEGNIDHPPMPCKACPTGVAFYDIRTMSADGDRRIGGAGFWGMQTAMSSIKNLHIPDFVAWLRSLDWRPEDRWVQVLLLHGACGHEPPELHEIYRAKPQQKVPDLRPLLQWFLPLCEAEMAARDAQKGPRGWEGVPHEILVTDIIYHMGAKLIPAFYKADHAEVIRQCANVANELAMIADNARRALEASNAAV